MMLRALARTSRRPLHIPPPGSRLATWPAMRNLLLVAILGLATVTGACGDADSTSESSKRVGKGSSNADPFNNDDPGETPVVSNDGSATAKPTAPATVGTSTGAFSLKVDNATPQLDIAAGTFLNVTATPSTGFTGMVTLTAVGLPAGVTAVFTPASVDVTAGPATAKVDFKSTLATAPVASAASSIQGVAAAASTSTASANLTFKVNNALTLTIPVNMEALNVAGKNDTLSSQLPATVKSGATLTYVNNSSAPYRMHSNGAGALPHSATALATGGTETHAGLDASKGNPSIYEHGTTTGTNNTATVTLVP